jgi:peptidoglycan/LPS O-acetylase OafA/YrhL
MAEAPRVLARSLRSTSNLSRVPYLAGLDGLRALAVLAVLVYHANSEWLAGGFLGVEVFFVISGYLITLLLMFERERSGRIDIGAFWVRRARRLLPALFVMLFLLLMYTSIFRADMLGNLRGDMLGGLLYVSNWYQIWIGQGYSSTGDFSPLRHLWSLAVEEQFYLLWPVVMMLLLRRNGTRSLALTARWLVLAAFAATVTTAMLYHPGRIGDCTANPEAYWTVGERCISKADSLYLSTITRSSGLLLGAAFAMVWRPAAIMRGPLRRANRLLDIVAVIGLLMLGVFIWQIHFVTPGGVDPWLFRGGFLWTSIATLMVIAAVTHSRTITSTALGNPVLVWVGARSYGLYLYSWPIYQVIRRVAGNALTMPQFGAAMLATVAIAEASYRFVESPIRRRGVTRWWDTMRQRRGRAPARLMGATMVVVALLAMFSTLRLGLAELQQNEIAAAIEAGEDKVTSIDDLLGVGSDAIAAPTPATTVLATAPVESAPSLATTTTTTTTTMLPSEPVDFLAIGDSVMLGAAGVLTDRGYVVTAEVSRQMIDMVPIMEQLGDARLFGDPVVVHLGTNGPITRETLDAFLAPLSGVSNVIILNIHADRPWTANNNALLAARDVRGDNIRLIDWNEESASCAGDCFADDGIHLSEIGSRFYADLIGDWTGR